MAKKVKKKKATTTKKPRSYTLSKQNKIILGSLLMLFSIALFFSFVSFYFSWQNDQSMLGEFKIRNASADNLLNKFGAAVSHLFMYKGFGLASLIIPGLLFLSGLYRFLSMPPKGLVKKYIWGLIFMIWISVSLGFFAAERPLLGGLIGYEINDFLQDYAGKIGVFLLLLFGLIFILVRFFKVTPDGFMAYLKKKTAGLGGLTSASSDEEAATKAIVDETPFEVQMEEETPVVLDTYTHKEDIPHIEKEPEPIAAVEETIVTPSKEPEENLKMEVEEIVVEKEEKDNIADKLVDDFGEFDPTLELGNYKFPHIDLLDQHGVTGGITINQEELEENKNKIVNTLKNYKIGIAQIKATIGPTVTLYEIVPEAGIRISKIKNLEDDIALSLAALGIRIIAPILGKGTIGIEVPNKNATIVSMRSVIASTKFQKAEMQLPIAFGKTISNETFVVDLAKMPHLLMAGATGQGKSVGLNAVLTSLLYKKHPAEVKFVLVDPKKVELTLYNKIERHFLAKLPDSEEAIITDNNKVINSLNSLCIEMDNRYELLKKAMVRNIKEYNVKFKSRKLNPNDGHKFLPYIVLVIDEFADLIMTAGKEVETPVAGSFENRFENHS